MNSKFILLNKSYQMIEYFDNLLINYPKKEVILKQNIEKYYYDLIECIIAYNINTTERIKEKYLKDYLIKLAMIDLYIKVSYNRKCISKHQFQVLSKKVIELRKITYGLIKKENNV